MDKGATILILVSLSVILSGMTRSKPYSAFDRLLLLLLATILVIYSIHLGVS